VIECHAVQARVGNFRIRDVSLTVPAGAQAVLTGPTASGKTTLLEVIAGAIVPVAGHVRIGGVDVSDLAPELRGVGIVPQHGYLFPHLDTRRNIEYGARDGVTALRLAQRFGVDHLLDRAVTVLSGGERQLVALCRALAARPMALLLDEPVSALDGQRRAAALREIAELQGEWGFSMLHVTHHETDTTLATLRFEMSDGAVSVVEDARV